MVARDIRAVHFCLQKYHSVRSQLLPCHGSFLSFFRTNKGYRRFALFHSFLPPRTLLIQSLISVRRVNRSTITGKSGKDSPPVLFVCLKTVFPGSLHQKKSRKALSEQKQIIVRIVKIESPPVVDQVVSPR